jgi:hypothetical protein
MVAIGNYSAFIAMTMNINDTKKRDLVAQNQQPLIQLPLSATIPSPTLKT